MTSNVPDVNQETNSEEKNVGSPTTSHKSSVSRSSFSMAHALSMIRNRRSGHEKADKDEKIKEEGLAKARAKRKRRRQNQKLARAKALAQAKDQTQVDIQPEEDGNRKTVANVGPQNSDFSDFTPKSKQNLLIPRAVMLKGKSLG